MRLARRESRNPSSMKKRDLLRRSSVVWLLACAVTGILGACGDVEGSGAGIRVIEKRADGSKLSKDDRAAADFVRAKLAEHWSEGPDGWTTELQQFNVFGQVMGGIPDLHFHQFRELRFTVVPEALSEAQRLNGVDYRGRVEFEPTAERWYREVQTYEGPRGWSDWRDGRPAFGELAVTIVGARIYPALKRARGEATTCRRPTLDF